MTFPLRKTYRSPDPTISKFGTGFPAASLIRVSSRSTTITTTFCEVTCEPSSWSCGVSSWNLRYASWFAR
jgi:hypothetical protein